MLKKLDLAARSLLIVGGLNWLASGVARYDVVAVLTRSRKRPNTAARALYGVVGGAALYSLGRLVEQTAFPRRAAARTHVSDAMTGEPQRITSATPIREAAQLLQRENVGSIPVIEGGKLVGILTDRDIALRVVGEGRDPDAVTAGEVATPDVATIEPTESLDQALQLMARRRVRRLPVVAEGELVGMLAQADLARRLPEAETGEVVEEISR